MPSADTSPSVEHGQSTALAQIAERLDGMSRKQQRLAKIVLENPEMIAFGSVRDVASRAGIDPATIVRFAKTLGYDGFSAFKGAIRRAYLQTAGLQAPRGARELSGPGGALDAMRKLHEDSIGRTYDMLAAADVDAVAIRLIAARRIILCADGTATIVTALARRLLRHVGLHGSEIAAEGVDRSIELHDVGAGDVVIAVGLWLTYRGPVRVVELARKAGATTVAITGSRGSPFIALADYVFVAPGQGVPLSFSVVAACALIEALIAQIAAKRMTIVADLEHKFQRAYVKDGLIASDDLE